MHSKDKKALDIIVSSAGTIGAYNTGFETATCTALPRRE
jgi:hypothetical protein